MTELATTEIMRGILADALGEADILQQLRERFMWPRLRLLEALVEWARARGEVGSDVSVPNGADALRPEELPIDLTQELHIRGVDRVSIDYRRRLGEIALGS